MELRARGAALQLPALRAARATAFPPYRLGTGRHGAAPSTSRRSGESPSTTCFRPAAALPPTAHLAAGPCARKNSGASELARALGLLRIFGRDLTPRREIVDRLPVQPFRARFKPGVFAGQGRSLRGRLFCGLPASTWSATGPERPPYRCCGASPAACGSLTIIAAVFRRGPMATCLPRASWPAKTCRCLPPIASTRS